MTDDGLSLDTFAFADAQFDSTGQVVPGTVTPDLDETNDAQLRCVGTLTNCSTDAAVLSTKTAS